MNRPYDAIVYFNDLYVGVGAHYDPFRNVVFSEKIEKVAALNCRGVEGTAPLRFVRLDMRKDRPRHRGRSFLSNISRNPHGQTQKGRPVGRPHA